MKECCRVDDEKPTKAKRIAKRLFWALLLVIVIGLAIVDTIGF